MKLSLRWLAPFVDISGIDLQDLTHRLTVHTAEVEDLLETAEAGVLLDIDNKTLTHRPDLFSHLGFAREIAVLYDLPFSSPLEDFSSGSGALLPVDNRIPLTLETPLCTRFALARVEHLPPNQPSSAALQTTLQALGTRPVSAAVDITNQMCLQYGQPMHAFDAEKISGPLTVRMAREGERLLALDGEQYLLSGEDIIIADSLGPVSIAGVMGGMRTAVSEQTTSILLEAAHFDPVQVRRTAGRLGIRTEASVRFEKSLNPQDVVPVLHQALRELSLACPGVTLPSGITDSYPQHLVIRPIPLSPERLRQVSGISITNAAVQGILERLGFTVVVYSPTEWSVTPPSWRATKDITDVADVYEEVMRVYGFHHIEGVLPSFPLAPLPPNAEQHYTRGLLQCLSARGYNEYMGYDFAPEDRPKMTGLSDYVAVSNPLSSAQGLLRQTLIAGIVAQAEVPLRSEEDLRLVEWGHVYREASPAVEEKSHYCLVRGGRGEDAGEQLAALREDLQALLDMQHRTLTVTRGAPPHALCHPENTGVLQVDGQEIGILSVVHPHAVPEGTSVVFAELSTAALLAIAETTVRQYTPPSPYPAVHRDVSVLLPTRTESGPLITALQGLDGRITHVQLLSTYHDAQRWGDTQCNHVYRCRLQAADHTLTPEEITHVTGLITDFFTHYPHATVL